MKRFLFFALASLSFSGLFALTTPKGNEPIISFLTDERTAQHQAQAEGKHYIIEFYASWCLPCRWMSESTLRDPEVIQLIETHYVPVRADIDQSAGFQLFQQYGITVLPTILILDEQGNILSRNEESLTIAQMLEALQGHAKNLPAKKRNISAPPSYNLPSGSDKEKVAPVHAVLEAPVPTLPDLPTLPKSGFSVQIGVYTQQSNLASRIPAIQALADHPIYVEEKMVEVAMVYKLLSGHFASRKEAEAWRAILADAQFPGYIRDLNE